MTHRPYRKPGLVPGFLLLAALTGCGQADRAGTGNNDVAAAGHPARLTVAGTLQEKEINEASGMAYSQRQDGVLWLHNDSDAKARVYAIDEQGAALAKLKLVKADNIDWEDIASFTEDNVPYLLVGDIGDNEFRRKILRLYVVAEPDIAVNDRPELAAEREIEFRYPDAPHDAEAIAVEVGKSRILLLTKRDIPPRLFEIPLHPDDGIVVTAREIAAVGSLPQPRPRDARFAAEKGNWYWQPTAMDISPDGSKIAILTYNAIYLYFRQGDEDWPLTLLRPPLAFNLENIRDAEALAFSPDGRSIFVTVEKKHAPLLRIDLLGEPES